MAKSNVKPINNENTDQRELELESADEIEAKIRKHCTTETFQEFFRKLDDIEDKRKGLEAEKKLLFEQMREKGCHPQGLASAHTRRHLKSKKAQTAIDVTFRVACELTDAHQELF